jgi:hypothetical protein
MVPTVMNDGDVNNEGTLSAFKEGVESNIIDFKSAKHNGDNGDVDAGERPVPETPEDRRRKDMKFDFERRIAESDLERRKAEIRNIQNEGTLNKALGVAIGALTIFGLVVGATSLRSKR